MSRIILGLDPGFADLGYGVIEVGGGKDKCLAYGSLRTPAGERFNKRLLTLAGNLEQVIAEHRPALIGIERLYFSTNAKTAMDVAEARGVIRLVIEKSGVPYVEIGPGEVKVAVAGHGKAAKPDVQKMVKLLLSLKEIPKPDDAADALAIALATAQISKTINR